MGVHMGLHTGVHTGLWWGRKGGVRWLEGTADIASGGNATRRISSCTTLACGFSALSLLKA